jgi:hypothetical protein
MTGHAAVVIQGLGILFFRSLKLGKGEHKAAVDLGMTCCTCFPLAGQGIGVHIMVKTHCWKLEFTKSLHGADLNEPRLVGGLPLCVFGPDKPNGSKGHNKAQTYCGYAAEACNRVRAVSSASTPGSPTPEHEIRFLWSRFDLRMSRRLVPQLFGFGQYVF